MPKNRVVPDVDMPRGRIEDRIYGGNVFSDMQPVRVAMDVKLPHVESFISRPNDMKEPLE
jgi:hypothetical protein